MPGTRIDVHVRRAQELPGLTRICEALQGLGAEAVLTADPRGFPSPPAGVEAGPIPCEIRVLQAGPSSSGRILDREPPGGSGGTSRQPKQVVIEGGIEPPLSGPSISRELEAADLVLVPGPARARSLASRLPCPVVPCGLPDLDALLEDPVVARNRARQRLGLEDGVQVVLLYAGSGESTPSWVNDLGDGIMALAATGAVLLVPEAEAPGAWTSRLARLERGLPALRPVDGVEPAVLLAAVDGVVGETGPLSLAAVALGIPVILLASAGEACPVPEQAVPCARTLTELLEAVAVILDSPSEASRPLWSEDLLVRRAGSAGRAAAEIVSRFKSPGAATQNDSDPAPLEMSQPADANRQLGAPGCERAFLERLEAQAAFGQPQDAIDALVAHLEQGPTARGWCLLATLRRKAGQLEEARSAAVQADTLAREELALVLCERARTDVEAARTAEARARFDEARELAPHLADAWLGVGSLELANQQHTAAELAFRGALQRDPRLARAWCGLGLTLLDSDRPDEAMDALESALDQEPGSLPAILGIVRAAFQNGRLERAERRVRACLEIRPGNVDLAFTLAGLRIELGDRAGAREMAERVELFRPDYPGLDPLRTKLDQP